MYLPRFIWHSFNSRYGINLKNLVDAAKKYETVESSNNREKILVYMCKNLLRSIEYKNYRVNGSSEFQRPINGFNMSSTINQMKLATPLTLNENEINISNQAKIRLTSQDNHLFTAYAYEDSEVPVQYFKKISNIIEPSESVKNNNNQESFTNNQINADSKAKMKYFSLFSYLEKNYLSYLYILVKMAYMLSLFSQVIILNRLMGQDFSKLGIHLIDSFISDAHWPQLAIFPRISLCEIYIREIATVHPYLIQCVLRINLFNELIFILVWFWLLFIISLTSVDLMIRLVYTVVSCSSCNRKLFALKYLQRIHLNDIESTRIKQVNHILIERDPKNQKKIANRFILVKLNRREELDLFEKFCNSNLTSDCVFALRIIQQNASNLIVSELIEYLWRQFKLLNYVYSNETNDFYFKRVISQPTNYEHIRKRKKTKRK